MDPNVFTYHISSYDALNGNDVANDCVIRLDKLNSNTGYICEVVNFVINIDTLTTPPGFLSLVCDNFIKNGISSNRRVYDIICDCSTYTGEMKNKGAMFQIDKDVNGRDITFQLITPEQSLFTGINDTNSTVWNLTLRMKAIK